MNLYIFAREGDLSANQIKRLEGAYNKVTIISQNNFDAILADSADKVLALDPDIVGWKLDAGLINKISGLKAVCLETTGFEWVDCALLAKKGAAVQTFPGTALMR